MRNGLGWVSSWCGFTALVFSMGLHGASFWTDVSPMWLVGPVVLFFAVVILSRAYPLMVRPVVLPWWVGGLLLVYAVVWFVVVYRMTGGATGVDQVNGQYVYLYKTNVLRRISEGEYLGFGNWITRVMSAWVGAISALALVGGVRRR